MTEVKSERSSKYWSSVSSGFIAGNVQNLWRDHADRVNGLMLGEWLSARRFEHILKTDIFDEAVGNGLFPYLSNYSDKVSGVDIGAETVAAVHQKFPNMEVLQSDVRDLPYQKESFDLIVSNSTLDHFDSGIEIERSLLELHRVLRPGGELIVSFDNLQNPLIWLRNALPFRLLNRLGVLPYFVGETLNRKGLVLTLENAGFEVLETEAIMHCPRVIAVFLAGIIQRHGSSRSQQLFLSLLARFEKMASWPTKYYSGHFVAARAVKPLISTT